jgi:D-alanine-D-alanine ligase
MIRKRTGPPLKVVLLYNLLERLEKGEEKDVLAEDAVAEEIGAVEDAVCSLGHGCFVIAIREEIFSVIHWLSEIQPDVVFNLCESVYGNTTWEMNIPAMLDLFHIPYTGSSFLTLGLCQDKGKVKDILTSQGILTPPYQIFQDPSEGIKNGSFPKIVKPLHEDGSLGISRKSVVFNARTMKRQIRYILESYHQPALVEEYVEGREMNVGLIETNGEVEVLPVSEIDYSEFPEGIPKICGYEAKWVAESPEYVFSKPVCPAPVEEQLKKALEETAVKTFRMFECRDYARVDFRVGRNNRIYVLEVNPNPDISPQSGMARALKAHGMTYTEFVKGILDKALERKN